MRAKWDAIQKANLDLNAMKPIMDAQVFENNMFAAVREKNALKPLYDEKGLPKGASWDKAVDEKFFALEADSRQHSDN